MTAPRGVGTHAAQPRASLAEGAEHALEVRRVGTVDHVVGRRDSPASGRIGIDGVDRRAQRFPARQRAVGLEREGDRRGPARTCRGARDADPFGARRHRDRGDHVGAGVDERVDLRLVDALRVVERHRRARDVAVAARPDAAAHDDRPGYPRGMFGFELLHEGDRIAVELAHRVRIEAELGAPIDARTPSRALEHEARARSAGSELEVAAEVAAQLLAPGLRPQQHECRELG